jgi:hypothetical protein
MRSVLLLLSFVLATTQATSCAYAQWDIEESHTTASLRGIHNVGGGVAWASGTNGTVLRTEDGGYLWQTCAIPPGAEKLDFRGVQAFDENTAIVMSSGPGDQSRLYKTTDGCETWKLVFTNPDKEGFWDAIKFSKDRGFGILLGDPVDSIFVIMLTFDGGNKWERQTLRATQDINGESVFAASNSSLLVTYPGYRLFGTGGSGGPRVISLGAGPTDVYEGDVSKTKHLPWSKSLGAQRLDSSSASETSGVFSLAENHDGLDTMVAVGGDYTRPNDRNDTAWTNAFVKPSNSKDMFGFHPAKTPPRGYRSAVAWDAEQKLWITVGPNGTDISTDDGKNWRPLTPSPTDPPDADKNWNALSLPFVVGPHGRIGRLRTIHQKSMATNKP